MNVCCIQFKNPGNRSQGIVLSNRPPANGIKRSSGDILAWESSCNHCKGLRRAWFHRMDRLDAAVKNQKGNGSADCAARSSISSVCKQLLEACLYFGFVRSWKISILLKLNGFLALFFNIARLWSGSLVPSFAPVPSLARPSRGSAVGRS